MLCVSNILLEILDNLCGNLSSVFCVPTGFYTSYTTCRKVLVPIVKLASSPYCGFRWSLSNHYFCHREIWSQVSMEFTKTIWANLNFLNFHIILLYTTGLGPDSLRMFWKVFIILIPFLSFKGTTHAYLL